MIESIPNWFPIETVPQDDTEVLLCWTYEGVTPIIRIGRFFTKDWRNDKKRFKLELDYGDCGGWAFSESDDEPTHWMPLPAPPREAIP